MSCSIDYMRKKIREVYNSVKWNCRVDHMPDNQVYAIYHSFLEKGRFDRPKKNGVIFKETRGTQLSLW